MLLTLLQSQTAPIVVIDTHDGDRKRRRRRDQQEIEERERRRAQIVAAYEHLVEGKPLVAESIVEEFKVAEPVSERLEARVDWDRLLDNLDAVERLYAAYLEMDDEDVLLLL